MSHLPAVCLDLAMKIVRTRLPSSTSSMVVADVYQPNRGYIPLFLYHSSNNDDFAVRRQMQSPAPSEKPQEAQETLEPLDGNDAASNTPSVLNGRLSFWTRRPTF
ncbi:hypothetical protein RRG08_025635 [Elysia crispata]|uniref:Uncharacterized protein n=1 Tax=Elysia crispata TaxID=231223 RepID=A0AAE1CX98_9GAST|nr:hypothetical protein RRG08_025635 [Elysia crispata]